ncbi:hypothetical protein [Pseudactinotalea sp.]|uniref:hypothetical protein n=1 Tax=Pseudactinotalea sp. TaxID=1926260 RepID=UPI003B3A1A2D
MHTHHRVRLSAVALATALAATVAGCGVAGEIADGLDESDAKEHAVDTGAEGKESQLLAAWVPDDARDVRVMQRTTGSERLLTFEYSGDVPEDCLAIATPGSPTTDELEQAYATDLRTAEFPVDRWSTSPTLTADWWPSGQQDQTTHLCGRWWVSADGGTFYAFGAELV